MEALSLAKVLMVTTFFWSGTMDVVKEETTLGLCNKAKVEAARFNNRHLGESEGIFSRRGSIQITCRWLMKSKEA